MKLNASSKKDAMADHQGMKLNASNKNDAMADHQRCSMAHSSQNSSPKPLPQINACHGAFAKSKFAMTLKQNRRDPLDEVKVEVGVSLGVVVEVDVEFEVDVEDGV